MAENLQHPFVRSFSDIWTGVSSTYKGMRLTISYFFRPKVTMEYPEVRPEVPPAHRGIHIYGEEECGLCRACEKACPVDCIIIDAVGKGKNSLITKFDVDYSKCLFCNLCCEACKPECIHLSEDYDIAAAERDGCVLHFARTKSLEEIEAHKEKLAQLEAEKQAKVEAMKKKKEAEKAAKEKGGE